MPQPRPTTEAEYLCEFGYAPDSAVGKLGWEFYSARTDLDRIALGSRIGWTVPATAGDAHALLAYGRCVERLRAKIGVAT